MVDRGDDRQRPRRSAIGGAAGEAGSGFRAGVAAYVAAHVLLGAPLRELELLPEKAVPQSFTLEADYAVDDVAIQLNGGNAFVQAKRHLDFREGAESSLADAVEQWVSLEQERGIDPARERLVAAAASASGPVHDLCQALRRRRRTDGGSYTTRERTALGRLEALLSELDEQARDRVLRSAVIWIADLEETEGVAARLGQMLLEPGVVAPGQGLTAWRTLRDHVRDLARRRYGADLDDLMQMLREVPLDLASDSEGYAAARQGERIAKLDAYRRRVQARGDAIDLRAIGAAVPPVSLAQMDAKVEVYEPASTDAPEGADERSHNGGLPWALRRRGRSLLLGLPGSGKSVALRAAAAHYAARPTWPLPIVVPLDRLGPRLGASGFGEALLEVAFEQEPVEEQAALRAAAVEALRAGEAALFLDSLDETRSLRQSVVAGIDRELSEMPASVEVLLSTRDVAYADAQTLGMRHLRLIAPDNPQAAIRAVIRAIAEHRQIGPEESSDWIRDRTEWARRRIEADRALTETPLMVVLLALLTVEHGPDSLPVGRATVLERIVSDVVVRWEAGQRLHGQEPSVGSLRGNDAIRAARLAFPTIGHLVFDRGQPRERDVAEAVTEVVAADFGLASGFAAGVAESVIALWDEAGVFVRSGAAHQIVARIRLFAELGEALYACALDRTGLAQWLDRLLASDLGREPVLLAAGLSEDVANTLAARAADSIGETACLDLVATAVRQGSQPSADIQGRVIDAVLGVQKASEMQVLDYALALVQFELEVDQQRRALCFVEQLSGPWRTVVRALSVAGWSRQDDDVEADLLSVLRLGADEVRRPGASFFQALGPDADYQAAVLEAGRQLLREGEVEVAELVNERIHTSLTATAAQQLRARLLETGFEELVRESERELAQDFQRPNYDAIFERDDEAKRRLLEIIAGFGAPGNLTSIQRRRLDDLVSLVRTSGFGRAPAGDATNGILKDGERLEVSLRAAATLGGLDLSVVSTQASELAAVMGEEDDRFGPLFMLSDGGERLRLTEWQRVDEPAELASQLAAAATSPYVWIEELALLCLVYVPAEASGVALARLEEDLSTARARLEYSLAFATLLVTRDPERVARYAADDRPMLRRAATRYWAGAGTAAEKREGLRALVVDADAGVRTQALVAVRRVGLVAALQSEVEGAVRPTPWQCVWCAGINDAGVVNCSSCGLKGPDLERGVAEALSA